MTGSRSASFWRRRFAAAKWQGSGLSTPANDWLLDDLEVSNASTEMTALEQRAMELFVEHGKVSTSFLQRQFQIGYNTAADIVEQLEAKGLISETNARGQRRILAGSDSATLPDTNLPDGAVIGVGPMEMTLGTRHRSNQDDFEVPHFLRRQPLNSEFSPDPEFRPVVRQRTRLTASDVLRDGFRRFIIGIESVSSVGDPKLHIFFAFLATALFALGQFFGGVCIVAYGLIMFAGGGRQR